MALTMTDGQERLIRSEQDDSRDVAQEHRHSLLAELDATRARVAEVERQQEDVKHHLVHLGLEPWHDGRSISDNKREWQQHIGMVLSSLVARLAAREAECAELRAALVGLVGCEDTPEGLAAIRFGVVTLAHTAPDDGAAAAALVAIDALSRPSGDFAALRAMLMQLSGMAWADLAPSREVDVRLAEAWVARLLPPATQAQEGVAE